MNPWGLGRTFGGEAESRFVTMNPDACQVLDDGRRVAAACLNNPRYRSFCAEWADAALDAGADLVFWDEPHWVVPEHVGVDDATRWSCRCDVCRERFGRDFPADLDDEVLAFREASLVDFLGELTAHVRSRGGRNTVCLLPAVEGAHGVQDWDAVASLPGVDVFATDPYWKSFDEEAGPFVRRFAKLLVETATRHGVALRALGPRVPPHGGRHPRPRGRGERGAGSGCRARVGLGLRGVRAHEPSRDARLARGLGARLRVARRADAADHRGRARGPRRPRPALVRRARLADERAGRNRSLGRRSCGRRDRGRGRRDRRADAARGTPDLRRRGHVRADRRGRRGRVRVDVLHACRARRRARRRRDCCLGARARGGRGRRRRRCARARAARTRSERRRRRDQRERAHALRARSRSGRAGRRLR